MKMVTSILALIVLFLSTQCMVMEYAGAATVKNAEKGSCSKKKTCSKPVEKESNQSCRTVCNPFMACSGCVYETSIKVILPVPSLTCKSVKKGFKNTPLISDYTSSPWKPPEFI